MEYEMGKHSRVNAPLAIKTAGHLKINFSAVSTTFFYVLNFDVSEGGIRN
jgi:hypothetical protein